MKKKLTPEEIKKIMLLRGEGATVAGLSNMFNCNRSTIFRALKRKASEGFPVPKGGGTGNPEDKELITLELTRNDTQQALYRDFVAKDGELPDNFQGWAQAMLATLLDDEIKF